MIMRRGKRESSARVLVVGAGIGGLTTAALLAQAGYEVTVLEAESYPGGSAGTFFHQGYRYDAGATLAGGFQPGGPHTLVGRRLGIAWPVRRTDPAWVIHLPGRSMTLTPDRADVIAQFPASESFWDQQEQIADQVWALAAQGLPWPPIDLAELKRLVQVGFVNSPGDLRLLLPAFQSARDWLARHGLADHAAFMRFIDAQLLISAQTTSTHANALYSATALDLPRQGVYHVEGGIGGLAQTLVDAVRVFGGRVLYKHRVTCITVEGKRATGVRALKHGRKSVILPADLIVANLTPWSLDRVLGSDSPGQLRREVARRDPGWGAFVLHLAVKSHELPPGLSDHHQIVTSMQGPLGEGRSVFVSLSPEWDSSRAPAGYRAVTATTHTAVQPWWTLLEQDHAAYQARKDAYTARLLSAIEHAIPGFNSAVEHVLPGTPVTYATWAHRQMGMVGGFPQGSLLRARGPRTGLRNVFLVGDSIFPGQSTAGVTLGALRVADVVQRALPRRSAQAMFYPRTPELTQR